MRLVGIDTMPVGATSPVSIPEEKKAEVALVLDYSGSMTNARAARSNMSRCARRR